MEPVLVEQRFLPALADALREWFPELGGRAMAVSSVTVTKENIPTLPLVMVALGRSASSGAALRPGGIITLEEAFVIEFWLEPARYKKPNGTETPFWSHYPYEAIRDTLLTNLSNWTAPGLERLSYRSLLMEADPFAVMLTFGFVATLQWCSQRPSDPGMPFTIGYSLCTPVNTCSPEMLGNGP